MKIGFFEIEDWEKEHLLKELAEHELIFTEEKLEPDTVNKYSDLDIASPFIYSSIEKEVLDKMLKLKFIATRSVGVDHIDVNYSKQRGVKISNVPKYGGDTVAEHAFSLILALSRKLVPSIERTRRGDFSLDNLTGFDLKGKTLGILGAGHIGKKVIEIALCFGMKVMIYTRQKEEELSKKENVSYVDLDTLLSNSDVITLHLPHLPETEHIINMKNIEKIKKGAILINTARGALVETQSILEGLERGILSGAGLDVLEEECTLKEERELLSGEFLKSCNIKTQLLNHVLLMREDVIITPHNAFNSKEALKEILDTTIKNIKSFCESSQINSI